MAPADQPGALKLWPQAITSWGPSVAFSTRNGLTTSACLMLRVALMAMMQLVYQSNDAAFHYNDCWPNNVQHTLVKNRAVLPTLRFLRHVGSHRRDCSFMALTQAPDVVLDTLVLLGNPGCHSAGRG